MSTAVIVPPPNSSSLTRPVPKLTERAKSLLTELNLHFAGVAALGVLVLYLLVHLIFVWRGLNANDENALAAQRMHLHAAEIAAKPLRGLDAKLEGSTRQADDFYAKRLPYATSQVAAELGHLTGSGVRLVRAQYAYDPVLVGPHALTQVRIDASVAGDYRPIVEFINALERDKSFFVINGINLTGQQTGLVNLRIRMTTYLRSPAVGEAEASDKKASGGNSASSGGPQ
jgi:type IV pilus assembly protein PilO